MYKRIGLPGRTLLLQNNGVKASSKFLPFYFIY